MIEIIEKIVLNARGVNYSDVHSKSRQDKLKEARQIVMYFTREKFPKKSFAEIAGYYGLDHATCMHSIKVINNLIDTNADFKEDIEFIRVEINVALSDRILDRLIVERNSIIRVIQKYQIKLDGLNDIINKLESIEQTKEHKPVYQPKPVEPVIQREPVELIPLRNDFKSPYKEMEATNGKPYSGYRQHSL